MIECPYCGTKRRQGNFCRNQSCRRVDLTALRTINISYEVNPSRMNNVPPRTPNNSFEKAVRKDERGVPYLDKDGNHLHMKESFNSRKYEQGIRVNTGGNG